MVITYEDLCHKGVVVNLLLELCVLCWLDTSLVWPLSENKAALKCQIKQRVIFLSDMLIYLCCAAEAAENCYFPLKRAVVCKWREVWKGPLHFSLSCIASKVWAVYHSCSSFILLRTSLANSQVSWERCYYLHKVPSVNAVMLHCVPWMYSSKLCLLVHWLAVKSNIIKAGQKLWAGKF